MLTGWNWVKAKAGELLYAEKGEQLFDKRAMLGGASGQSKVSVAEMVEPHAGYLGPWFPHLWSVHGRGPWEWRAM